MLYEEQSLIYERRCGDMQYYSFPGFHTETNIKTGETIRVLTQRTSAPMKSKLHMSEERKPAYSCERPFWH